MPRFVILTHDYPVPHWDFMLEKEAALRTWRLTEPPDRAAEVGATPLPDHRLLYLDYEGPVSGNRGNVTRWEHGEYAWTVEADGHVEVVLEGTRLKGRADLRRTPEGEWRFSFTAAAAPPS